MSEPVKSGLTAEEQRIAFDQKLRAQAEASTGSVTITWSWGEKGISSDVVVFKDPEGNELTAPEINPYVPMHVLAWAFHNRLQDIYQGAMQLFYAALQEDEIRRAVAAAGVQPSPTAAAAAIHNIRKLAGMPDEAGQPLVVDVDKDESALVQAMSDILNGEGVVGNPTAVLDAAANDAGDVLQ